MDHLKSEFRDFQEDAQNKLQQLEAAKELAIREKREEEQRAKLEKAQLEKEKLQELQAQREAADREKEEQIDILIRKSKEALKKKPASSGASSGGSWRAATWVNGNKSAMAESREYPESFCGNFALAIALHLGKSSETMAALQRADQARGN